MLNRRWLSCKWQAHYKGVDEYEIILNRAFSFNAHHSENYGATKRYFPFMPKSRKSGWTGRVRTVGKHEIFANLCREFSWQKEKEDVEDISRVLSI
jgi:hypothetical protein